MSAPGTIGVVSADLARYADFWAALVGTYRPAGTKLDCKRGPYVDLNRNNLVAEMEGDWLWQLDDDHGFAPDLLMRLLEHEVDIVAPLCLASVPPYAPTVRKWVDGTWRRVPIRDIPEAGLLAVDGTGGAGLLVRRPVYEKLGRPWFIKLQDEGEDLNFCRRVRDLGFTVYVDCGARLGHVFRGVVYPRPGKGARLHLGHGVAVDVDSP